MPRQKTTQIIQQEENAKAKRRELRELLAWKRIAKGWERIPNGLEDVKRGEFRDALLNTLVHGPSDRDAEKLLGFIRRNREKGELGELLAVVAPRGRSKRHTEDFWIEAISYFWAHEYCKLSQTETLFYFGKIRSLDDDLTRNQRRDFKNRTNAIRQAYEEDFSTAMVLAPLLWELPRMSEEERKAWAIRFLQKIAQAVAARSNPPRSK
jgi:hypothetical protein